MKKTKYTKVILPMLLCTCMLFGNLLTASAAKKNVSLSNVTFDVDYYYNNNPDLQIVFGYDYDALLNHYLQYGLEEGRSGSEEFNCKTYRNNYSDLRTAFGKDYVSYCLHYEQYGKAENRDAITQTAQYVDSDTVSTTITTTGATGTVLGSYSTNYNAAIQRAINVELAASRINGIILQPGQSFSFSRTILPRTAENGYVEATVISGGEFTTGYGGGVCQVSSTLYAAMLDADLPATERHPHSLPVSYMPEGMDATIAGIAKDLKFENIFDHAIQIVATTDAETGTLTISIMKM